MIGFVVRSYLLKAEFYLTFWAIFREKSMQWAMPNNCHSRTHFLSIINTQYSKRGTPEPHLISQHWQVWYSMSLKGSRPRASRSRRHCIRIGGLSAHFLDKNLRAVHSLPFLQRPTVTIMFALMASQFQRLWWLVREEAESEHNQTQSISIVLGLQII